MAGANTGFLKLDEVWGSVCVWGGGGGGGYLYLLQEIV